MIRNRRENVGTLEAYIRVSGGLVLLALAAFGRMNRLASWAAFAAGTASVASGITRYCPFVEAIGGGPERDEEDGFDGNDADDLLRERSPVRSSMRGLERKAGEIGEVVAERMSRSVGAEAREAASGPKRALARRLTGSLDGEQ